MADAVFLDLLGSLEGSAAGTIFVCQGDTTAGMW
jgi:hypothetical protein